MSTAHSLPAAAARDSACLHCGQLVATAASRFCCAGCEAVFGLIRVEGLERYYDLRGTEGVPVVDSAKRRDRAWLEELANTVELADGVARIACDVQGMHCSACVWLFEELFRRQRGAVSLVVNPTLGRLSLSVVRGFPLASFIQKIEAFGYVAGPVRKDDDSASRGLLARFGVCVALTMNTMIFAISAYAGLSGGSIARLFETVQLGLASAVVAIGGSVFFRAAIQSLRARAMHLDLPIALGIALAYSGSVDAYRRHAPAYFDTVCVFVTLMLLGRFLQQRVLEKNRKQLLGDGGADSLLTRRVDASGRLRVVPCGDLALGDVLSIAPGDLVPVEAELLDARAEASLDWINGESRPRAFSVGDALPAGAFNAGNSALRARVASPFAGSQVHEILRTPARNTGRRGVDSAFLRRLSPLYVGAVLALAALAFIGWWLHSHDLGRALSVTTAMLVVTCPCAFGIATPLAYELVQARLRRRGLFVRSADFLDKAPSIRKVVFDKTGTLTDGTLEVVDASQLLSLDASDQAVLAAMASSSTHPKSDVVRRALEAQGVRAREGCSCSEVAGRGVEAVVDGHCYRFGAAAWAGSSSAADVVFSRDDRVLAALQTTEALRADAASEVSKLACDGLEVWMLSGDEPSRVVLAARACGVDEARAIGGASPEDKARWVITHDAGDVLMVGDGINDLVAVATATCSGTPATDRPFVASRADFYFVSPGLSPIREALVSARALARVVKRNFAVATAYNVVAVSLVLAGHMSPLLAAILMPISSLSTLASTSVSLSDRALSRRAQREGSRSWKS